MLFEASQRFSVRFIAADSESQPLFEINWKHTSVWKDVVQRAVKVVDFIVSHWRWSKTLRVGVPAKQPFFFRCRHKGFSNRYGNRESSLTSRVKTLIINFLKQDDRYKIQSLMEHLCERLEEGEVPPEKPVRNFVHNIRKRGHVQDRVWLLKSIQ